MKNLLLIMLTIGSLITSNAMAGTEKRKTAPIIDTFTVHCLFSSANIFYAAELGEKQSPDKVDSLVGVIDYDSTQSIHLALVSASDLGFKNLDDVQWSEILDSAISHGYKVCPPQIGPEIYLLSQCKKMHNIPVNVPVFIGMPEIKEYTKHKFLGITAQNEQSYIFCLKTNAKNKSCELGYTTTKYSSKHFCWTSTDKFLFVKVK